MEFISCRITYQANDNPKCMIMINDTTVHKFIAVNKKGEECFQFEVPPGPFVLKIVHYDKNMKTDLTKYIEIKTMQFNGIDFKDKIWDTTQIAEVPSWQNAGDYEWRGNLYLGHNGYLEYKLRSPVLDFLLECHTKGAKVSSNMGSYDMELLYEMKDYFSRIVKEQDEKS